MTYDIIFDKGNKMWRDDHDHNEFVIRHTEQHLHNWVNYRGYVFLNEMLDVFKIDRVKLGQIYGYSKNEIDITYDYDKEGDFFVIHFNNLKNVLEDLPGELPHLGGEGDR